MKPIRISKLIAAHVDTGNPGMPGSYASEHICDIYTHRSGKFSAESTYSTGSNQGYYREDYSHGPWHGFGASPEQAVEKMLDHVPPQYLPAMKEAAGEALTEAEGITFPRAAQQEAARIEALIEAGKSVGAYICIAGQQIFDLTDEDALALRKKAVAHLRKIAGKGPSILGDVPVEDLIEEISVRGLVMEAKKGGRK